MYLSRYQTKILDTCDKFLARISYNEFDLSLKNILIIDIIVFGLFFNNVHYRQSNFP